MNYTPIEHWALPGARADKKFEFPAISKVFGFMGSTSTELQSARYLQLEKFFKDNRDKMTKKELYVLCKGALPPHHWPICITASTLLVPALPY